MAFKIISSLRYDPQLGDEPFYMLQRHRDRMLRAAKHFDWPMTITTLQGNQGLEIMRKYLKEIVHGSKIPQRISIRIDEQGVLSSDVQPTPELLLTDLFPERLGHAPSASMHSPWPVYLDAASTQQSSFTRYKTTSRDMYTQAKARVGLQSVVPPEVILYNERGEIMDGSITNAYFWREGRWVTPPLSSGGQDGTTREYALDNGLATEEIVHKNSLQIGEKVYLSNGVRGFIPGIITQAVPLPK